ncbi:GyrI-like domain-containing protein [Holdemania massiliensis]|uniref:Transcriptional regulator n=2 Tax=Holdemania massiliensis TaxID=1468449 RepID=A0A6N7S2N3_9FIRM|nr:GyrI-like domain-containing protein [Holdemania massiliensis]MSA70375.1 transcriptional regulator [Holdemania massiliensis]MSA88094.1 transcriptional regulator [Holdemania massiliensis]MSB76923.1 transcriptional regulator [Holdemania massiliensis]MSC31849.1 transcriptional regulator [Holdemania massiliensis]MSC38169.1 transcriptional regulator [Holdemania massiliensis]
MAYDFKKEAKMFYMPKNKPEIVTVPPMTYLAVRGQGNPNEAGGPYQKAVSVLYAIAYTLKMSYKGKRQIAGFYEYVVPPLEGFWWQPGVDGVDYANKNDFHWISVIRVPDFIQQADFDWAVEEAQRKKQIDCSSAEFLTIEEGLCVQMRHIGVYDDEPASVAQMDAYIEAQGYENELNEVRMHHEIYLSDPRKCDPAKQKTVIRHPIRKKAAK